MSTRVYSWILRRWLDDHPSNGDCQPASLLWEQLHDQKQNTMKKYKLLKNLPGVMAGTVYIPEHGLKDGQQRYIPSQIHSNWALNSIAKSIVENNPDWFQKVEEPIIMSIGGRKWRLREINEPIVRIEVCGNLEGYLPGTYNCLVTREYWLGGKLYQQIQYKSILIDDKFYALESIEK